MMNDREQLIAHHVESELVAEGIVDRDPEGLVYDTPKYRYYVDIRVFEVPLERTVRLAE